MAAKKVLALASISLLFLPLVINQGAFADGLFQHDIPASIGDRDARLFIQINPPILTAATQEDAFLQLRLFDARTDETIRFTTFIIEVTKGTDRTTTPLLRDAFHTESGLLTLKIQPQEGRLQIFGTQEDFLNAWKADPGGTINLRGPLLLEAGLYRIRVDLLTVDSIRTIFPPGEEPSFETFLSVGDIHTEQVQFGGNTYPTTVISYYDRITDFDFDAETMTYGWSMPFDWDLERVRAADAIFIHEEIMVPKSFTGMGDQMSFNAWVNGVPLSGRMLTIDPFSSEENLVIHFLINRNDILAIGQNIEASTTMQFALAPASNGSHQTSSEIATDTGGMLVLINWTPDQLSAGTESILDLEFHDAFTGDMITGDVAYNLRVYNSEGTLVHTAADQVAADGLASHTLTFPTDEVYQFEVEVTGVTVEGQAPDVTRNGIAIGTVVVPEFPLSAITAAAAAIGSIIAIQRLARKT